MLIWGVASRDEVRGRYQGINRERSAELKGLRGLGCLEFRVLNLGIQSLGLCGLGLRALGRRGSRGVRFAKSVFPAQAGLSHAQALLLASQHPHPKAW